MMFIQNVSENRLARALRASQFVASAALIYFSTHAVQQQNCWNVQRCSKFHNFVAMLCFASFIALKDHSECFSWPYLLEKDLNTCPAGFVAGNGGMTLHRLPSLTLSRGPAKLERCVFPLPDWKLRTVADSVWRIHCKSWKHLQRISKNHPGAENPPVSRKDKAFPGRLNVNHPLLKDTEGGLRFNKAPFLICHPLVATENLS